MGKLLLALTFLVPVALVTAQYYGWVFPGGNDYNNGGNDNNIGGNDYNNRGNDYNNGGNDYNNRGNDYNNGGNNQRGSFSQQDLDSAFKAADDDIRKTEDLQRQQVDNGRLISDPFSPESRHQITTLTTDRATQMDKIQRQFEDASVNLAQRQNLSPDQIRQLESVPLDSSRSAQRAKAQCEALFQVNCRDSKYRTFDGTCNNLNQRTWGSANTCLQRFLPPRYDDGIRTPRMRMADGQNELPNARFISEMLHEQFPAQQTRQYTHLTMQFGQFLDHDLDLTPSGRTADNMMPDCCPWMKNDIPQCFPIFVRREDPFYSQFKVDCLNVIRSAGCPSCTLGPRQQTNQLTAYVDASNVYGNGLNSSNSLRDFGNNGKLAQRPNKLPPPSLQPTTDSCSNINSNQLCFRAGDARVNQQVALVAMHTVWIGQHNRIADLLRRVNPGWNDEKMFQETRRIVIAQMQMVVYSEFLPVVLGDQLMQQYDLAINDFTRYDPTINAGIFNEFAAAAFRFGHSLIQNSFTETNYDGSTKEELRLKDNFFKVLRLYQDRSELDRVLLGLVTKPGKQYSPAIVTDVTNHLYETGAAPLGLDLPAINVQRGRDHGIPGYVEYVRQCTGRNIRTFDDLRNLMAPQYIEKLANLYGDPQNIDLFTGGVCEFSLPGAIVGPTFGCIIAQQFRNLKYGDRYFFTHLGETGSFSQGQIQEILKTSFAKIICDNGVDLDHLQPKVFLSISNSNPITRCSDMPDLDPRAWREFLG